MPPIFFSYPSSACIFSALSSFFPIFFKDFTFACLTHPQGKVNGRGWQDYGTAGLQDCGTGSQCAICPSISPNTRCQSDVNPTPLKPAAPGKGNTQSSLPNNPYKVPFLQRTGAYTKGGGRGEGVTGWPGVVGHLIVGWELVTANCELSANFSYPPCSFGSQPTCPHPLQNCTGVNWISRFAAQLADRRQRRRGGLAYITPSIESPAGLGMNHAGMRSSRRNGISHSRKTFLEFRVSIQKYTTLHSPLYTLHSTLFKCGMHKQ